MGATDQLDITGAKGGESKPKTPVETPDSLQSTNIAKILLAVGEGEFDGTPTDRDIYLDNTPIMDASGNVNFPGGKRLVGRFVDVRITAALPHSLRGEILTRES